MAVDSTQLNSTTRDAYWRSTRAQLDAARRFGDIVSIFGLVFIAIALWFFREPGKWVVQWAITVAVVSLAIVAIPQWFVARRKRLISLARGLACRHCGYPPHDTEICEVARTRQCPRCEGSLD